MWQILHISARQWELSLGSLCFLSLSLNCDTNLCHVVIVDLPLHTQGSPQTQWFLCSSAVCWLSRTLFWHKHVHSPCGDFSSAFMKITSLKNERQKWRVGSYIFLFTTNPNLQHSKYLSYPGLTQQVPADKDTTMFFFISDRFGCSAGPLHCFIHISLWLFGFRRGKKNVIPRTPLSHKSYCWELCRQCT